MASITSREIRLAKRPVGMPTKEDFTLASVEVPDPAQGQVRVKNLWMSVDPYMRGRMIDAKSYVPPFQVGQPLDGGAIGQIESSNNPNFQAGDLVSHGLGWREAFLSDGTGLTKIPANLAPPQTFLGTLGMPGLTAYAGLLNVGALKDGETVFVSAASGAVGAIVCQIAKIKGCRVIGSAGSDEKCAWLTRDLGVDAAINYKTTADLNAALAAAAPNGIDVYFENVGGQHLVAAINNMRVNGRIALCGMIEQYNATSMPAGPGNIIQAIPRRLTIAGFVVSDYWHLMPDFLRDMGQWIAAGKIKWKETVVEGIDKAPDAFLGLFKGENFGKMLVKLG